MYRQMEGGPIGLRGTCTLARLVMQVYDKKWLRLVEEGGINLKLYMRYMDDGRKFLQPIKRGWRWEAGSMVYRLQWELEDEERTPLDMTISVLRETVRGVLEYLRFTFESGEDYVDGWLPALDTSLRVNEHNQVEYHYYEKPTTSKTTIQSASAMGENSKMQCLSNDLVRRLMNTMEGLPDSKRAEVIDNYGVKLMTSGFSREQCQRMVVNGIKGYLRMKERRMKAGGGQRIHLTAQESQGSRVRKKLMGKSSWFKGKKKDQDPGQYERDGDQELGDE